MSANKYLPSKLKFDIETNPFRAVTNDGNDDVFSDSFYYDDFSSGLKSTQQLNVDWSRFENHTFFMPAEVKTNIAFEQIINKFPFDGTKKEVRKFLDGLTGFEKWVFDSFPKNLGSLDFYESYIIVKDSAGNTFTDLSKNKTGDSKINPLNEFTPLSIEFMLTIPEGAQSIEQKSVICQKISSSDMGFSVHLINENQNPKIQFLVVSGSKYLEGSCDIEKSARNHLCISLERNKVSANKSLSSIKIFNNESLLVSTEEMNIGFLDINNSDFIIGSGSKVSWKENQFIPENTLLANIDEFRIFHSSRTLKQQQLYSEKNIFPSIDESGESDVRLYYKFNEPKGLGSESGVVLDSSGNSLHSYIQGYNDFLRKPSVLKKENESLNPVLFPGSSGVLNLNKTLLEEASNYDSYNPNLITKLIPPHFLREGAKNEGFGNNINGKSVENYSGNGIPGSGILGSQQILLSFLFIWAKFFDEIKLYVDQFSNLKNVDYDDIETVPNNLLDSIFDEYGLNFPSFFSDSEVQQYLGGEDIGEKNENPLKWIQSQISKRTLISLPAILSSKGTQQSIKSFLKTVGLDPDNSVIIKEYGGPNRNNITNSRENRKKNISMLKIYDSSYVKSDYLSGSRIEPGWPGLAGNWVNGQSNNKNDGLFTSGSWFIEGNFKFIPEDSVRERGLMRLMTVGSLGEFVTHNLTATPPEIYGDKSRVSLSFYNIVDSLFVDMSGSGIFDGEIWNISFGKIRNDDPNFDSLTTQYHLRVGKQNNGEISSYYANSISINDLTQSENINSHYNASGSFISIGKYENQFNGAPLTSTFDGMISNLRFWSKGLSQKETKEHIKNIMSFGSDEPEISYNFNGKQSGSFGRLRLDSIQKQGNSTPDLLGGIEILDFTNNFSNLNGHNFFESTCFSPEVINYSQLSTNFDEDSTNQKVRYRGVDELQEDELEKSWITTGGVYKIIDPERRFNNNRFTVEFSLVEALNRDITNMFSSYEKFNNYLGDPNLLFSGDYPEISHLSEIYFNRHSEKLNFAKFFEFYRWFDSSIGLFIDQLIPKRTNFKGTQHTIEPHMLERSKIQYYYHENYTFNQFEKKNTKIPMYESLIRKY